MGYAKNQRVILSSATLFAPDCQNLMYFNGFLMNAELLISKTHFWQLFFREKNYVFDERILFIRYMFNSYIILLGYNWME